jgi:hypothetical protein
MRSAKQLVAIPACLFLCLPPVFAQQVSGAGTPGQLAKFTAAQEVGDSVITEQNGNIGIGMTPEAKLHIGGVVGIVTPSAGLAIDNENPGFSGTNGYSFRIRSSDHLSNRVNTDFLVNVLGFVGIGTSDPQNLLHVGPGTSSILTSRVDAVVASNRPDAGIAIAQNNGVNVLLQASGGGYIGTTSNHPLILRRNDLDTMVLDGFTTTIVAADLRLGHQDRRGAPGRAIVDSGAELVVNFGKDWPQTTIGSDLGVIGKTTTQVLEITGGADLAEPFEIAGAETIQPGMVVAIDPERPGQLRMADKAYDRTVAGIISGANGIKPGLTMRQEGTVADGGHPVALTGRIYCWADAAYGPIEPGDLLTTSDTLGHAMKVTDHLKAQGAIIGKAMAKLDQGKGLVLVLVTLQ